MKMKLFSLFMLLVLALGLTIPVQPAAANGANRVDFTAESHNACNEIPGQTWCANGQRIVLPNGKAFMVGDKAIMRFTASDPRWNVDCYYAGDPYPPGNPNAYPVKGSFTCYPRGLQSGDDKWVGTISQVFQPDKYVHVWSGKGYGVFDRLLVQTYNSMSSNFDALPAGDTDMGYITELPGYQP